MFSHKHKVFFIFIQIYFCKEEAREPLCFADIAIVSTFGSKENNYTLVIMTYFFIVRCLRPEAYYAIFSHLDLQLTNQLEPVEGSTYKTGVKRK